MPVPRRAGAGGGKRRCCHLRVAVGELGGVPGVRPPAHFILPEKERRRLRDPEQRKTPCQDRSATWKRSHGDFRPVQSIASRCFPLDLDMNTVCDTFLNTELMLMQRPSQASTCELTLIFQHLFPAVNPSCCPLGHQHDRRQTLPSLLLHRYVHSPQPPCGTRTAQDRSSESAPLRRVMQSLGRRDLLT